MNIHCTRLHCSGRSGCSGHFSEVIAKTTRTASYNEWIGIWNRGNTFLLEMRVSNIVMKLYFWYNLEGLSFQIRLPSSSASFQLNLSFSKTTWHCCFGWCRVTLLVTLYFRHGCSLSTEPRKLRRLSTISASHLVSTGGFPPTIHPYSRLGVHLWQVRVMVIVEVRV